MSKTRRALWAVRADTSSWERAVNRAGKATARARAMLEGLASSARRALFGMGAFAAGVMSVFVPYERAMTRARKATRASEAEYRAVEKAVEDVAAKTEKGAKEIAQGVLEMAKAGLSAAEQIQLVGAATNFAVIADTDMTSATQQLIRVMKTTKTPMSDAGKVMDMLTRAMTGAQVNMDELSHAVSTNAAIMTSYGQDTETVLTLNAKLFELQGETAGRGLRRLTLSLGENAAALRKVGIEVYNSDGSMRDLVDIIADYAALTRDMTDEERARTIKLVGSTFAQQALNNAITIGADELREYRDDLRGADGAAKDYTDALKKDTMGVLKRFLSALEKLAIIIGQKLKPYIEKATRAITGWVDAISKLPPDKIQEYVDKFIALGKAIAGIYVGAKVISTFAAVTSFLGVFGKFLTRHWSKIKVLANARFGLIGLAIGGALALKNPLMNVGDWLAKNTGIGKGKGESRREKEARLSADYHDTGALGGQEDVDLGPPEPDASPAAAADSGDDKKPAAPKKSAEVLALEKEIFDRRLAQYAEFAEGAVENERAFQAEELALKEERLRMLEMEPGAERDALQASLEGREQILAEARAREVEQLEAYAEELGLVVAELNELELEQLREHLLAKQELKDEEKRKDFDREVKAAQAQADWESGDRKRQLKAVKHYSDATNKILKDGGVESKKLQKAQKIVEISMALATDPQEAYATTSKAFPAPLGPILGAAHAALVAAALVKGLGEVKKMQYGGFVQGSGGIDSQLVRATPGEFFVPPGSADDVINARAREIAAQRDEGDVADRVLEIEVPIVVEVEGEALARLSTQVQARERVV